MEDEDIAPNTYIQLIQSVWAESHASSLCSSMVNRHDFLPISCMYIYRYKYTGTYSTVILTILKKIKCFRAHANKFFTFTSFLGILTLFFREKARQTDFVYLSL